MFRITKVNPYFVKLVYNYVTWDRLEEGLHNGEGEDPEADWKSTCVPVRSLQDHQVLPDVGHEDAKPDQEVETRSNCLQKVKMLK